MINALQEEGKKLQVKSLPIGKNVATGVGEFLLMKNTAEAVVWSNVNTNCFLNGGR